MALEKAIDYSFNNKSLLQKALTHRSYSRDNNERLEFLGDSILNFKIAAVLFDYHRDVDEGDLSRLRAHLVNKASLVTIGKQLDLGQHIRLGGGELKSGGWRRESIIADAVEAIIGAVYKDSGIDNAMQLVIHLYKQRLQNLPDLQQIKDAKTRLQELLQAANKPLPSYAIISVSGKAHQQLFAVECALEQPLHSCRGSGKSRRKAEQDAAAKMLNFLKNEEL